MDEIDETMAALNGEFRRTGDPARVRHLHLEADHYLDGYWVLWATLELPPPENAAEPDVGPHETHEKYEQIIDDVYDDNPNVFTMVEFRTADDLAESPPRRGWALREPVSPSPGR
jgi:hypothetical protein